ncbi:MAG TPA: diphthine synthase [Thermoplasmatales archaeon]|nr:diphthine synthase [Thermoplasmatales archaeon]
MSGELIFIGMGLGKGDLTIKALNVLRRCDVIFCELYTSKPSGYEIEDLERLVGKKINVLERREVEDGDILIKSAFEKRVAFLVVGDPMVATTHVSLRMEAEKRRIKTKVINGVSVITAVPGILGLQHYKFGRATTLAYPENEYFPLSPYYVIKENLDRGLHTLVLLDINRERGKLMTIKEGIELLFEMEEKAKGGIIREDMLMCGVARAGSEDCAARAAPAKILRGIDFGDTPHTLVVPGNLHFVEEEALEVFAGYRKMR